MMMPITYANNFMQYDKSIIAFQENDQEITYGYVEEAAEKDLLFRNSIWTTIHCFNKWDWESDSEDELGFLQVFTTETLFFGVSPKNGVYSVSNSDYTNVNVCMFSRKMKTLALRKATFIEAYMLIKDNDSGMRGASKKIKELVHEKVREMLVPSYKMFILGHNDDHSFINIIPKDIVFEIIKISNHF